MKKLTSNILQITLLSLCATALSINAKENKPLVYVNKSVGFNIEGFQYNQPALPCDVDKKFIELLVKKGQQADINVEAVEGKDKVQHATVPVVLIDIEQLTLGKDHNYGTETNFNLPKIQITAGIRKGDAFEKAKHTCAMAASSTSVLPTEVVKYNNPIAGVCVEAEKCLEDLSKDVIDWIEPQVK